MFIRTVFVRAIRFAARTVVLLVLAIAFRLGARTAKAQTLDTGTQLHIRLLDPVSSHSSMRGHSVRALLIAPAPSDTVTIVPPGTVLDGTITGAGEAHHPKRQHFVTLEFTQLETPDGHRAPISAQVSGVDNASETVDSTGRILGLPPPGFIHSKLDWALLVLGSVHPVAAAALFATFRGESRERHRNISYLPGVEMEARLTSDATIPMWPAWQGPPVLADTTRLDSLLRSLPPRTTAFHGTQPADLINLVFIGTEQQVRAAFLSAGWDTAERLTVRTGFDVFVDAARARGYDHQPVSQLLLDGRPPDMVFQKLTDTFAKRHHVRIWRSSATWGGSPIYVAAATHDVGIEFLTNERKFTHRVDPRIDLERDKVVDDLITAYAIDALSFVRRTPIADVTMNREKNPVVTDWGVAVASVDTLR